MTGRRREPWCRAWKYWCNAQKAGAMWGLHLHSSPGTEIRCAIGAGHLTGSLLLNPGRTAWLYSVKATLSGKGAPLI